MSPRHRRNPSPTAFEPWPVSIGFCRNHEWGHSRVWSKRGPLPSPRRMLELGIPSYPPAGKADSLSKLMSAIRRRSKARAPGTASLGLSLSLHPSNPSEGLHVLLFCGRFQNHAHTCVLNTEAPVKWPRPRMREASG